MKKKIALLLVAVMLISTMACSFQSSDEVKQTMPGNKPQTPPSGETVTMTQAQKEYNEMISDLSKFPVNFIYDGTYYAGLDKFEEMHRDTWEEGNQEGVKIYLRIDDTLVARAEVTYYHGYEAYDYTVYFENYSATENSGVLEQLNAVDMTFQGENARLKGILGDHENQYLPYDYDLSKQDVNFTSLAGRATHVYFPYFNLETDDGGALLAIGWGGTWQADFKYDEKSGSTHYTGTGTVGMETYLKPGEIVRTPLIATVRYYTRDEDAAMNQWRKWMIDCNLPSSSAESNEPLEPFTAVTLSLDTGKPNSDGSISESYDTWQRSLDSFYNHGLTADYRWVDAGWYYSPYNTTTPSDWWGTVGTWEMDAVKWPNNTFREMTDYTREHGTKTLLWFEPERVTHLDGMVANYGYNREWVLSDHGNNNCYINNLGNEECLEWTLNRIISTMEKNGVDLYREDFNIDPGIFWSIGDGYEGEKRTGITENLYMQGHYGLWDGIIKYCGENGKSTFIDSCASGGGRNDLESMRRAVPLLRSDSDRTTIELRLAMTSRLVQWIPFTGAATQESSNQLTTGLMDIYVLRASYLPHYRYKTEFYHKADTLDWDTLIQGMEEWEEINDYFYADFYQLTPYRSTTEKKEWTVWEYFDEETDSGVIQAFRLPECKEDTYMVQVKGVDPNKYYSIRDIDGINTYEKIKGSALMNGVPVYAENPRTALILYIEPYQLMENEKAETENERLQIMNAILSALDRNDLAYVSKNGVYYIFVKDVDGFIASVSNSKPTVGADITADIPESLISRLSIERDKLVYVSDKGIRVVISSAEISFAERPSGGTERFSYLVNSDLGTDLAIIQLPTNYSIDSTPVKLVIYNRGAGTSLDSGANSNFSKALLNAGYAILHVRGIPEAYQNSKYVWGDYGVPYGSPAFIESVVAAYEYVTEKYNISTNGCAVFGASAGGLQALNLVNHAKSLPIKSVLLDAPVVDLHNDCYFNGDWGTGSLQGYTAAGLAWMYQFDYCDFDNGTYTIDGTTYSFSSKHKASLEKLWQLNINKVKAYNPYEYGVYTNNEGKLAVNVSASIQMWFGVNEGVNSVSVGREFIQMCANGGANAVFTPINSDKHVISANHSEYITKMIEWFTDTFR